LAGRPRIYEEKELIAKAMQVFWQNGYKATSLKDLKDAMNIGEGSFYVTFKGGKKELFQKTLLLNWEILKNLIKEGSKKDSDPILFLKGFYYSVLDRSREQAMNGCYVGNAIVEFRNLDEETRAIAFKLMSQFEKEVEKLLILAQKKGKLSKEKSPAIIAKCLINLWNGINITQRANQNKKYIKNIIETNLKMLLD